LLGRCHPRYSARRLRESPCSAGYIDELGRKVRIQCVRGRLQLTTSRPVTSRSSVSGAV
jgi:hypothetical protein